MKEGKTTAELCAVLAWIILALGIIATIGVFVNTAFIKIDYVGTQFVPEGLLYTILTFLSILNFFGILLALSKIIKNQHSFESKGKMEEGEPIATLCFVMSVIMLAIGLIAFIIILGNSNNPAGLGYAVAVLFSTLIYFAVPFALANIITNQLNYNVSSIFNNYTNSSNNEDNNKPIQDNFIDSEINDKDDKTFFKLDDVTFCMIKVEGGLFTMGASNDDVDAEDDEKPAHEVKLDDYFIGQTEVTQELWQKVMGNNPSRDKGYNNPVNSVSWNDCQEFINRLNTITGQHFRFPTEAEWEFAARGGNKSKGYKYAGSNNLDDVAWYNINSQNETHPVAKKIPNELDLYDMLGNLWEWCGDGYVDNYYIDSPIYKPLGPIVSSPHVVRGGCWFNDSKACRVSNRSYQDNRTFNFVGLRLAL